MAAGALGRLARLGLRPLPAEHRLAHDARPPPLLAAPAERVADRPRLRPGSAPRRRVLERRAHLARDRGRLAAAPHARCGGSRQPPDAGCRRSAGAGCSDASRRTGSADAAPAVARRDRRLRGRTQLAARHDPPRLADRADGRRVRRAGRAVAGDVSVAAGVHDRGQGPARRRTIRPRGAAAARRPADQPQSRRRGNRRAAVAERVPDRARRRNRSRPTRPTSSGRRPIWRRRASRRRSSCTAPTDGSSAASSSTCRSTRSPTSGRPAAAGR